MSRVTNKAAAVPLVVAALLSTTALHAGPEQTDASSQPVRSAHASEAWALSAAGRLSALSEHMARNACFIASGIEKGQERERLERAAATFETTLEDLTARAASLGLGPSGMPDVVKQIGTVRILWSWYGPSVSAFMTADSAHGRQQHLENIVSSAGNVRQAVSDASDLMSSIYEARGTLAPTLSTAITLAARQRALSQKMAREYCMIASGLFVDETRAKLAGSLALYESSQARLFSIIAGITKTPELEDQVLERFAAVNDRWALYSPMVRAVVEATDGQETPTAHGNGATQQQLQTVLRHSVALEAALTRLLEVYETLHARG